jgi:hypothetical protein
MERRRTIMINTLLTGVAKSVGALLLALVVLWPTAETAGTTDCEAVIHVMDPQIQVVIDEQVYCLEAGTSGPIVCQLRPGRHLLRAFREASVIQEEEFSLQPGQQGVFTAWDEMRANAERQRRDRMNRDLVVLGWHRPRGD